MKLRNKKTGLTGDLTWLNFDIDDDEKETDITILLDDTGGAIEKQFYSLYTLKKFLDEWEEYEPTEPLIKDKKLRNIVKEWCKYYNISNLQYRKLYGVKGYYLIEECGHHSIDVDIDNLEEYKYYSVKELCGE